MLTKCVTTNVALSTIVRGLNLETNKGSQIEMLIIGSMELIEFYLYTKS